MKIYLLIIVAVVVAVAGALVQKNSVGAQRSVFGNRSKADLERVAALSLEHLKNRKMESARADRSELKVEAVVFDRREMAHAKVRQTIDEIPVWGGEAIVHLKSDGSLASITDDLKDQIDVGTKASFSPEEAIDAAMSMYKGAEHLTEKPKADLWIYRGKERDHLAYRVQLRREDGSQKTAMPVIFVDAQTGERLFQYDNLQSASATSLYSGTVSIGTSGSGSTYYMEDLSRRVGTFTYSNGTSTASRLTDTDNVWNTASQRAAVDAHYGATLTLNYFQNVHGRNGIDGSGGPFATAAAANGSVGLITSRVNFGSGYNNAFWNGYYMTYGDGDGSNFSPLTTIDICGHEMTHGITERTAGLIYLNESGAINEAVSDIFGALVERSARGETANTWKIGEEAFTPYNGTTDALRYMNNPTLGGQPEWYGDRYTGAEDNGGVHINSGIANYAFYLMAKGGTTSRGKTVVGTNADEMGEIWYRALTVYMTSGTDFAGARAATLSAADDLFGSSSAQYAAVADGWCAVGVGSCFGAPATPTPTPTATPSATPTPFPTPSNVEAAANGGFESQLSPWVKSGTGTFHSASGFTPYNGSGVAYFGVGNNVSGQIYQQITIPTNASGNLRFYLNVVSNESTTRQFDKLYVDICSPTGAIWKTLAVFSNQDASALGNYSLKSYDVLSYVGKNARIQFRVVTDGSTSTTFRIDNVSVN